jgi:protein-S-isoprenylcysteine O-methyltransferase Ste14
VGARIPSTVAVLWVLWLIYWSVAGARARDKATRWQEPWHSQLLHMGPLIVAGMLLATPHFWPTALNARFLPGGPASSAIGLVFLILGMGLSIWARHLLGSNWSSAVALKEHHTLARSGPYRVVRHPIYSGLLLAIGGTALDVGEWRGLVALGLALAALIYKSRNEEQRMREIFPEYEAYQRTTAALVPFIY